jgi:metal-responsive CopG/Arc/MetJ family transcriptional regulator
MSEDTRRINVIFPERLLEELDALVPAGKRSEVIVEATAAYLARLKVLAALKATAGAWTTADHPELATPEDVNRWLAELRSSWRRVPLFAEGRDG